MAVSTTNQIVLDMREQAALAQAARQKAVALTAAYADPRASAMLQKLAAQTKALAREEEQAARARRKAQVGGVAEGLEHGAKKLAEWQGTLNEIGNRAAVVFGTASASVLGFVSAASPAHWQTFTGSMQMLSAAVGEMFTPAVKEASGWIQKASAWVRGLDDATKGTIVRIALWTVGIGGAVLVLGKLGVAIFGVGKSILGALAALESYLAVQGRLGTTLAAWGMIAVAIGGVAYALSGARLEMQRMTTEGATFLDKVGLGLSFFGAQLNSLFSGKGLTGPTKFMQDKIEQERGGETADHTKERNDKELEASKIAKRGREGDFGAGAKEWFDKHTGGNKTIRDVTADDFKKLQPLLAEGQMPMLKTFKDMRALRGEAGIETPEDRNQKLLLSMGGLMPRPQMTTGSGYGESLQMNSLLGEAEGDQATDRLAKQIEQLNELLGEKMLKGIEDQTEAIKRIVPPWRV